MTVLTLVSPEHPSAPPRRVFRVFVPGKPVPRSLKTSPKGRGVVLAKTSKDYQRVIARHTWRVAMTECPEWTPMESVRLDVVILMPRKKFPKKAGVDRIPHLVRPDRDNILKQVQDGLQRGINGCDRNDRRGPADMLIRDDSCIWCGSTIKWYAAEGEDPGVHLTITEV